jgi:GDPmannose 4,6-dehydratase
MGKTALITGITGQDGSYLAELLLDQGYEVHGLKRRSSQFNTQRIDHLYQDPHEAPSRLTLHHGDLSDGAGLARLMSAVQPDEVYNLAAQSHVAVSFEMPEYTADVVALGTLRLLEAIRGSGLTGRTRFYQAGSSEMFGLVRETPQRETTPFHPRSPYGVSKVFAHWITVNYREAHGLFACNGLLFNHESPRRGETFVTRKITRGLCQVALGLQPRLYLGNLDARRDWGHARDFVQAQWLMLQQDTPGDYVIATGEQHAVRDFVSWAAEDLGIGLRFEGTGRQERGIVDTVDPDRAPAVRVGDCIVEVDPRYLRPAEVDTLLGEAAQARAKLGWQPRTTARALCREMVAHDLDAMRQVALLRRHGHVVALPGRP